MPRTRPHVPAPPWFVVLLLIVSGCPADDQDEFEASVCEAMTTADTLEVTAIEEVYFNDEVFVTKELEAARVNVIVGLSGALPTYVEAAVDAPSTGMLFAATEGVVGGWWREDEPAEMGAAVPYDNCPDEIPDHWVLGEMEGMVDYHVEFSPTEQDEVRLLLVAIAQ